MKTMTCRQLGGACDQEFHAETFEEMGNLSKKHAVEMAEIGDQAHTEKMDEMMGKMSDPEAITEPEKTASFQLGDESDSDMSFSLRRETVDLQSTENVMNKWFEEKQKEFDALPEDE